MSWLRRIAERAIEAARDAGDLDDLSDAGKPLSRESLSTGADPVEEAGHRIMKKEGAVPPEVILHRKVSEARHRLTEAQDEEARRAAMKELADLQTRLAILMERRRGHRW